MKFDSKYCDQCGYQSPDSEFQEGVCKHCFKDNQDSLGAHNFYYDRWQNLSNQQREDEIKKALL